MIQRVTMPVLGETVERATIEGWRVKEGDRIQRGDILCDITTDKATLEVESFYSGTILKIVAPAGVELPVETLIAVVGDPGEKIPDELAQEAQAVASGGAPAKAAKPQAARSAEVAEAEAPSEPQAAAMEEAPAVTPGGRIIASPRARKIRRSPSRSTVVEVNGQLSSARRARASARTISASRSQRRPRGDQRSAPRR